MSSNGRGVVQYHAKIFHNGKTGREKKKEKKAIAFSFAISRYISTLEDN